ncbi:cadmium-induced protein AS8 isoform X2 [Asparagus officinalis]|nr:cadmium-induced protein AS8 isoform X2 [Asparagus officinalis]
MIIKGLFKRYERWNPVHPTLGTFWGMGIGIGCGVGWGPGFGPEVIGYVGAGCGVGFSVGFTLAGIGVGLPMNGMHNAPTTSDSGWDLARSSALASMKGVLGDGWNYLEPHVSSLRKETSARLSSFKFNALLAPVELTKINETLSINIQSTMRRLETFKEQHWPPSQGWED